MCNSSGSSRSLLNAVTAQQCCDPKTGIPTILSTRAVAHRPLSHIPRAAANAHTSGEENRVSGRLCFPATANKEGIIPETAPVLNTIPRGCWTSSCSCCAVMFPLELHTLMHGSALPVPSQGMISYLCQTHTHHGESKQWCQKREEQGGYSSDSSNEPVPVSVMQTSLPEIRVLSCTALNQLGEQGTFGGAAIALTNRCHARLCCVWGMQSHLEHAQFRWRQGDSDGNSNKGTKGKAFPMAGWVQGVFGAFHTASHSISSWGGEAAEQAQHGAIWASSLL